MKHAKKLFLSLIAILAIFTIVSCGGNELPDPGTGGGEVAKTPNLDAYRTAAEAIDSGTDKVFAEGEEIIVVGKVIQSTKDAKITLTDGKPGTLRINYEKTTGDQKSLLKNIKNGDTIEIKIKKISANANNGKTYQIYGDQIEVLSTTPGAPVVPTTIKTLDEYNAITGEKFDLPYIKIYLQVATIDSNNLTCQLVTPEDTKNFDANTEPKDSSINLYKGKSEGDTFIAKGLYEVTGIVEYNKKIQIRAYTAKRIAEPDIEPFTSNFAEFYSKPAADLRGATFNAYLSYHNGKEMVITDPTTAQSIYVYSDKAKSMDTTGLDKVTVTVREAGDFYGKRQIVELDIVEAKGDNLDAFKDNAEFKNATVKTALEWTGLQAKNYKKNHPQVKLENVTITKSASGKNYDAKFADKVEEKDVIFTIKDFDQTAIPEAKLGTPTTVYGVIGIDYDGSKDVVVLMAPNFIDEPAI